MKKEDFKDVRYKTAGIIAASTLAVGLYGNAKWWNEGFNGEFKAGNEGWFGKNTYAGGADKLGHFYVNYTSTRLFTRAFEWAGNSQSDALTLAAWTMAGTYTAVEVIDGFSKEWSFSKEDAVMNLLGVGAALLLEKKPELDRLVDLRLQYWPSADNDRQFEPFGDYSGQTYLIVLKANGMPAFQNHSLMRYVEFAAGYNARGFSKNPVEEDNRSRNLYVGLSLNLSELLGNTVFKHSDPNNKTKRATDMFLEFVQVPGTFAGVKHEF